MSTGLGQGSNTLGFFPKPQIKIMVSEFLRKERNGKTLLYANVLSKDFLLRVNNSGFYVKC